MQWAWQGGDDGWYHWYGKWKEAWKRSSLQSRVERTGNHYLYCAEAAGRDERIDMATQEKLEMIFWANIWRLGSICQECTCFPSSPLVTAPGERTQMLSTGHTFSLGQFRKRLWGMLKCFKIWCTTPSSPSGRRFKTAAILHSTRPWHLISTAMQ